MRLVACAVLVAGFAATPSLAGDWKRLLPADLSKPAQRGSPLRALWSAKIQDSDRYLVDVAKIARYAKAGVDAPFLTISHRFQASGAVVVTVSMALYANVCDGGANSATSTQLWSVCPMKIEVTGDGPRRVLEMPGCYLDVQSDRSPGAPDVATNGSFAYLDPRNGELTVEAIQGGKAVPDCTKVVQTRS